MDPKTLFQGAVKQASGCLQHIQDDYLKRPTPCTEWNLRKLLNHMIYEIAWVPDLVAGKTIAEVGSKYDGDMVGQAALASWEAAAAKALAAVENADLAQIAHLSYGDVPLPDYIREVGGDIFVHTWDVDQAMNSTLLLDPAICEEIYNQALPKKEEMARSGLYGVPFDVPENADIQTKLLALFGRRAMTENS